VSLQRVTAAEAAGALDRFDAVIDARSESEFALDHLPRAVNWPTLDDQQRHRVGTEYKQISAFDARKHGAIMAARNIAAHLEREADRLPRGWRPLVYCWRGGQRSGALALVLGQVGFEVSVLEGGYRAFRKQVLADLDQLPLALNFQVLCGRTGSGKSRLLETLAGAGAQVLDLEALAAHRGSVLGGLPGGQPGQKRFETTLWDALRHFDAARAVFVESESRTIGRLRLPEALLLRMRASACTSVEMPRDARIELLLADYRHLVDDAAALCERLDALRELRGHAVIDRWQTLARSGQMRELVGELLDQHYDPIYLRSMARNFARFETAEPLTLADGEAASLQAAAQALLG
jgi:tRNA 2-selenouridine synthase